MKNTLLSLLIALLIVPKAQAASGTQPLDLPEYTARIILVVLVGGGIAVGGLVVGISWSVKELASGEETAQLKVNVDPDFMQALSEELTTKGKSLADLEILMASGASFHYVSSQLGSGPLLTRFFEDLEIALIN